MNNIKKFYNYIEENKHIEDGNIKIFNKQKEKIISQNKEYNFEPIPDKFKDDDINYSIVISKKIPIGDKNPVKKFKEWNGKYWRKKKDKDKKYESLIYEAILPKTLRNKNLLYHSTTFENFEKIMKDNTLYSTDYYDFGVATSRNKDYVFGRDDDDIIKGGGEIQIILDKNKLQSKYKIKPYDFEEYKLTNKQNLIQAEDKIYKTIRDLDKYIVGFHINKNYSIIYDYILSDMFKEMCQKNNWIIFDKKWNIIKLF